MAAMACRDRARPRDSFREGGVKAPALTLTLGSFLPRFALDPLK